MRASKQVVTLVVPFRNDSAHFLSYKKKIMSIFQEWSPLLYQCLRSFYWAHLALPNKPSHIQNGWHWPFSPLRVIIFLRIIIFVVWREWCCCNTNVPLERFLSSLSSSKQAVTLEFLLFTYQSSQKLRTTQRVFHDPYIKCNGSFCRAHWALSN